MTKWEKFFDEKIKEIAKEKNIIDIGGGFRFQKGLKKYEPLFRESSYRVLDIEAKYGPDIIGDIHNLPFQNESIDAIICKAVLEHVYSPQRAVNEMRRVLRKQGKCLVYLPFLYPYHALKDGYKDYYRYTEDGIRHLFKEFDLIEICPVRGNLETLFNLVPLRLIKIFIPLARFLDRFFSFKQVSGYNVFLIK